MKNKLKQKRCENKKYTNKQTKKKTENKYTG